MFWEQLLTDEQTRYWDISQREKKYVAATLALPKVLKDYEKYKQASEKDRQSLVEAEERRHNHWIRDPNKHIKIDPVAYCLNMLKIITDLSIIIRENTCTDAELIEADRLRQKGWGG